MGNPNLSFQEQVIFDLRSLYQSYGYRRYKMSKFEEYDLYARNKDFLLSDRVITFMDINGKVMALKPDVTLSIVKNSKVKDQTTQKLYYNENIYRVPKSSDIFREMMQVGLECIGDVDDFCLAEAVTLAAKSLQTIHTDAILNISDFGLLVNVLQAVGISAENRDAWLQAIGKKNGNAISQLGKQETISEEDTQRILQLVNLNAEVDMALGQLFDLLSPIGLRKEVQKLETVLKILPSDVMNNVRFDMSLVDDANYYNGILMKGFVPGVPNCVLSGGQYDNLMKRMGRKASAVGFAVYLDTLERLHVQNDRVDVDVLILYDDTSDLKTVLELSSSLRSQGKSVMVQSSQPEFLRYQELVSLQSGGKI